MWPCTQFYTPKGLILSDIWARRFRPARARYPAHFSQKKHNNNGQRCLFEKRLSSLCRCQKWPCILFGVTFQENKQCKVFGHLLHLVSYSPLQSSWWLEIGCRGFRTWIIWRMASFGHPSLWRRSCRRLQVWSVGRCCRPRWGEGHSRGQEWSGRWTSSDLRFPSTLKGG